MPTAAITAAAVLTSVADTVDGYAAALRALMPCLGATWVLTNRLGPMLGTEMLLGAARYRGRELREREAPVSVVGHKREVGGHLDTLAHPAVRHLVTTRYGQS